MEANEEEVTTVTAQGVLESERIMLARKIGVAGTLIACAVARLYLASPNRRADRHQDPVLNEFRDLSDTEWKYTNIMGFAALVIDHKEGSLIIRLYQYKTYELRFAYEVYYDMEYKMLDPQFHAFEIENCVAGLSFSVKPDALLFHSKIKALRLTSHDGAATILRKMRHPVSISTPGSSVRSANPHASKPQPSKTHVDCTPQQVEMLKQYQEACKKYEADMAKYKAEQAALAKYEEEKKQYLQAKAAYQERLASQHNSGSTKHSSNTSTEQKEDDESTTIGDSQTSLSSSSH